MEIQIKAITLFAAIILTGLSAGFFYAWEFTVIPGTKKVGDHTYIETMQSINRAIINPAFMLIFFGTLAVQVLSTYQFKGTTAFWFLLAATAVYSFGSILVTIVGNVPMNNALDVVNLNSLNSEQLINQRSQYEPRWNRLHSIRTAFSVISFMLLLLASFVANGSQEFLKINL